MSSVIIDWGNEFVTDVYREGLFIEERTDTGFKTYHSGSNTQPFRSMQFRMSDIVPNSIPTKFIITATYRMRGSDSGSFRLVKQGLEQEEYIHSFSTTTTDETISVEDNPSLYELSDGVYGICFCHYYNHSTAKWCYVSSVSVEIEYVLDSPKKIYNGENNMSKAYLGNQPISSIYLGNNKLL